MTDGSHFVKIWLKSLCSPSLYPKCTNQLHICRSHWPASEEDPYRFLRESVYKIKTINCVLGWNGWKCNQNWFTGIQIFHHFVKIKKKLHVDLKWWEMRSKVIMDIQKWWPFCETKFPKVKVAYWYEITRNAIKRGPSRGLHST